MSNLSLLHRTNKIFLFENQILFCELAGTVGVNTVKHYLRRPWMVSIATILSKTFKIQFIFLSAIANNWPFFAIFKQTVWSVLGYHTTLSARCYVTQRAIENLSALQGTVWNLKKRRIKSRDDIKCYFFE